MARMKRGKNHFSQNKFSHSKKNVYNKDFDKSKIIFYNYNKKGHYEKEFHAKPKGKGIFHASTTIED